jgi:hypothetical protein
MPYLEGVRAEALWQTKLAFDDLVSQLCAGQDPPGVALPFGCSFANSLITGLALHK